MAEATARVAGLAPPHGDRISRQRRWRSARRLARRPVMAASGLLLLLTLIAAIFAPLIAPHDPLEVDLRHVSQSPNTSFWLGTDEAGRDVLSRLIYGARASMTVGLASVAVYMAIGVAVGGTSGLAGGWVDGALMRLIDVMFCFPSFMLTLILVGIVGPSVWNVVIVLGVFGWPGVARIVRGQVLQLRATDYILAARSIGAREHRVLLRHVLPNLVGPLTVIATLGVGGAILAEAGLSFLGLGVVHPDPSWGAMLSQARSPDILAGKPWLWLAPGLTITLTVLAVNFIGDGLQERSSV